MNVPEQQFDVFICHASEDKNVVRRLVRVFAQLGVRVWLDEMVLRVGDSLRRSIDQGLANSRYGVVVLSPSFFRKEWPQRELDGLVAREANERRKLILPVWHEVTEEDVRRYSPPLADKLAPRTSLGTRAVAKAIFEVIKDTRRTPRDGPVVKGIDRWIQVASVSAASAGRKSGISEGIVDDLMRFPNVLGVDIGPKIVGGKKTNLLALRVHVRDKLPKEMIERPLPTVMGGIPIDVVVEAELNG
jgi:TIR domain-containing protein